MFTIVLTTVKKLSNINSHDIIYFRDLYLETNDVIADYSHWSQL